MHENDRMEIVAALNVLMKFQVLIQMEVFVKV